MIITERVRERGKKRKRNVNMIEGMVDLKKQSISNMNY